MLASVDGPHLDLSRLTPATPARAPLLRLPHHLHPLPSPLISDLNPILPPIAHRLLSPAVRPRTLLVLNDLHRGMESTRKETCREVGNEGLRVGSCGEVEA